VAHHRQKEENWAKRLFDRLGTHGHLVYGTGTYSKPWTIVSHGPSCSVLATEYYQIQWLTHINVHFIPRSDYESTTKIVDKKVKATEWFFSA
jgi:hypothetical protein